MLRKMFNFRPFLNTAAVERYEPLLNTLARDMSDDELTEAHKALNRLTSIVTGEQIRREESGSIPVKPPIDGVPYCLPHDVWHVGTCEQYNAVAFLPTNTEPKTVKWAGDDNA